MSIVFAHTCAISVEWSVQHSYHFPFLHPQSVMAEDVSLLLNVMLNTRKVIPEEELTILQCWHSAEPAIRQGKIVHRKYLYIEFVIHTHACCLKKHPETFDSRAQKSCFSVKIICINQPAKSFINKQVNEINNCIILGKIYLPFFRVSEDTNWIFVNS